MRCESIFHRVVAVLLMAGGLAAQVPEAWGWIPVPDAPLPASAPILVLNMTAGATLELSGGWPGGAAAVVVDRLPPIVGRFDAAGTFSLPVPSALVAPMEFVARGYGADADDGGRPLLRCSDAMRFAVAPPEEGARAAAPAADFSLLRIELDSFRSRRVVAALAAGDLATAVATALNSDGDELRIKLGGKVLVPVEGVSLGGSTAFTARLQREHGDYLLSVGRDLALLVGVKASEDIGIEGGIGLGSDEIYRFASPEEVGRGLLDLALLQAIGESAIRLQEQGERRADQLAQRARAAARALHDYRSRIGARVPAVERALARTDERRHEAAAAARRVAAAARGAVAFLARETRFVLERCDGAELRASITGEVEIKVGKKAIGRAGAELGTKISGAKKLVVRLRQRYGEAPSRIVVSVGAAFGGGLVCRMNTKLSGIATNEGPAIEVSGATTVALETMFDRLPNGELGTPTRALTLKREVRIGSFARETRFAVDAVALLGAGDDAVASLTDCAFAELPAALDGIDVAVAVQDRWITDIGQDVGLEKGMTAKVGFEAAWSDCGPERQAIWNVDAVLRRIGDVDALRADAEALLAQADELGLIP